MPEEELQDSGEDTGQDELSGMIDDAGNELGIDEPDLTVRELGEHEESEQPEEVEHVPQEHQKVYDFLRQRGFDLSQVPDELKPQFADIFRQIYEQQYVPVAEQLRDEGLRTYQAQQQVSQVQGSQEWELASYLIQNPTVHDQVVSMLNGTSGQHQTPSNLPNVEEMTDTEKAIWNHASSQLEALSHQNQALMQQLEQFGQTTQGIQNWAGQFSQWHTENWNAAREKQMQKSLESAYKAVTDELGFDPSMYKAEWSKAFNMLESVLAGIQAKQGQLDPEEIDFTDLLRQALDAAGYYKILEAKKREANSAVRAPGDRVSGGRTGPQSEWDIVNEAAAELGIS